MFASVKCTSNNDCNKIPGRHTCKQQVDGEVSVKTCEAANSCTANCDETEFCAEDHTCRVSDKDECGTSEDCEMLYTNKTICMTKGKLQTCVVVEDCSQGEECTDDMICSPNDECTEPGTITL